MRIIAWAMVFAVSVAPAIAGTTGGFSGHVVSRRDGAALPRVLVRVSGASNQCRTRTDQHGYFSCLTLGPGRYVADFERVGYIPGSLVVPVEADRFASVHIEMDYCFDCRFLFTGSPQPSIIGTPATIEIANGSFPLPLPGGIDELLRFVPGVFVVP